MKDKKSINSSSKIEYPILKDSPAFQLLQLIAKKYVHESTSQQKTSAQKAGKDHQKVKND